MEGTTRDIRSRTWRGIPVASLPTSGMAVYVLHFTRGHPAGSGRGGKQRTVRHYIGYSPHPRRRVEGHRTGRSYSYFCRAMAVHGIRFRLARVWLGAGPAFEHYLKRRKDAAKLCPICTPSLRTGETGKIAYDAVLQAQDVAIQAGFERRQLERVGVYEDQGYDHDPEYVDDLEELPY